MDSRSVLSATIEKCEMLSNDIVQDIEKVIKKSNELHAELKWIKSLVMDNSERNEKSEPNQEEPGVSGPVMNEQTAAQPLSNEGTLSQPLSNHAILDVLNEETTGCMIPGVQLDELNMACPIAEPIAKGTSCDQEPAGASLLSETVFKSTDLRMKDAVDEPESDYVKVWNSRIDAERSAYHKELGQKSIKNITVSGKV